MDLISRIILWFGRQFPEAFARQLGNPSGLTGRAVGYLLNRAALETKERALELLDLDPDHRVLEIGFGGGGTLEALHELVPTGLAAGIEISDTMVQAARVRFRREIAAGHVEVSSASVARIPVDDASFDRALAINTVYFWEDPLLGLEEIARVLKPGGMLLLGIGEKQAMERMPWVRHGFRIFEPRELEDLLQSAGFRDIRCQAGEGAIGRYFLLIGTKPGRVSA
jgi:SAM-dependent methyltransferase